MNPDTRAGLLRAADACETAGVKHAATMLRSCADKPNGWYEDEPEVWLSRASFACDCFFYNWLGADNERAGLCTTAGAICDRENDAAMRRRLGISQNPGPAKCERCSDGEPCVECKTRAA